MAMVGIIRVVYIQVAVQLGAHFFGMFGCNCRCFRINAHDQGFGRNKHTMDAHIAITMVRPVILMFSDVPRDGPQILPLTYDRRAASWKAHLSKGETYRKIDGMDRSEHASMRVERFLRNCEERRSQQHPPPKKVVWENRLKWNSSIINLIPVVGGPPVVFA